MGNLRTNYEKINIEMAQPKVNYAYIVMETTNVNHTALYTAADKTGELATDSFKRLYSSPGGRYKDLKSREHDEVISRAVPVLGFRVSFREVSNCRLRRRFVVIYKRINSESMTQTETELQNFFKHFRRHEGTTSVLYINDINNVFVPLELLQ